MGLTEKMIRQGKKGRAYQKAGGKTKNSRAYSSGGAKPTSQKSGGRTTKAKLLPKKHQLNKRSKLM